ncbi:hypothetical protein HJD18_03530 [Thermoleophilia bacterium SCSIO 60948]|nr:hypothetical protein HJD18_03530 [Thermoleophilia bacterium SCSIO 60948]
MSDIDRRLRRTGASRFLGFIKPHGADEGIAARFRITGYRDPARAQYLD